MTTGFVWPRWLWWALAMAGLLRFAMAQIADIPLHPDEIFQYLEQGFRLAHGYGIIPWEYVYGIRSWLIPGLIAAVLETGAWVGLDRPWQYMPLVQACFVLISLTLPPAMYRLTRHLAGERAAIAAFLLGCFWHHFVYLAPKPMPSALATYGLVWLAVWMLDPPSPRRLLAFGVMSGLVLAVRYQLLPVVGLMNLFMLLRLRAGYGPALAGNLLVLGAVGTLDLVTWGGFLSSFIDNFRLNFVHDIASDFGREEVSYYAKRLTVETGGLVLPAALAILLIWRKAWPIIVALLTGFLFFHIPAHKELRFVIWLVPFILVAAAIAADRTGSWLAGRPGGARLAPVPVLGLGLVAGLITAGYGARYAGLVPYKEPMRDGAVVMRHLARQDGLIGVEFRTRQLSGLAGYGYYALGQAVPLYLQPAHEDIPSAVRLSRISHLVTDAGTTAPAGFVLDRPIGTFSIWRATSPPAPRPIDPRDLYVLSEAVPSEYRPFGGRVAGLRDAAGMAKDRGLVTGVEP